MKVHILSCNEAPTNKKSERTIIFEIGGEKRRPSEQPWGKQISNSKFIKSRQRGSSGCCGDGAASKLEQQQQRGLLDISKATRDDCWFSFVVVGSDERLIGIRLRSHAGVEGFDQ